MGKYVASRPFRRSVADTLLEAEQEHLLDCPNADLAIRSAALLLDLILCSLGSSGIHHFCTTLLSTQELLFGKWAEPLASAMPLWTEYTSWMLRTVGLYMYFIWCLARFGGTPAKLVLGLRVIDAATGTRLSYAQIFLREVIGKVLGSALLVSLITPLLRDDRRGFHDLISASVVKRVHGT